MREYAEFDLDDDPLGFRAVDDEKYKYYRIKHARQGLKVRKRRAALTGFILAIALFLTFLHDTSALGNEEKGFLLKIGNFIFSIFPNSQE